MRRLALILTLLGTPSILCAQRMGTVHFSGHAAGFHQHGFRGAAYYPLPFFDSYDSGYVSDAAYRAPSQPVIYMMQAAPAPTAPDPTPPAQPLMIELQGDRYVQVSGDTVTSSQMVDRMPAVSSGAQAVASTAPPKPAATVLIFRDGHRQEISTYTMAEGTLYAATDYYTSGTWNQKIAIASLNLPETIAANQQRGVQFRLPAAPNEVIVGP